MSFSLEGKTGMNAPKQSRKKQRVVIEFLLSKGETAQNISKRLKQVYGDGVIDYSTVTRWVKRINDGQKEPAESDLCDRPKSGRPSSVHSSANIDQADALIKKNRRITINELAEPLGISAGSAVKITDTLGYSKVRARLVPRQLTEAHKQSRLEACFELLEYCHSDKTFLQRIVTGDETMVHHFEPESKRASMKWRHPTSPRSKKFKSQQSAGKVMVTVFWDSVGVILIDFMSKGATINSDVYIDTLKKLKARIRRVRSALKMSKILLQHDNARPYTSLKTLEVINSFGWTTISHPPYSPDLAPSDFHLFGPLKESLRGQHFFSDEEVKTAIRK